LDIIWIKIHHLKGENTWKSSRRLDSNGLDIGRAFCSKRRLIRNIAFCSKRRLIRNIAFCSKRRLIRMSGTEK